MKRTLCWILLALLGLAWIGSPSDASNQQALASQTINHPSTNPSSESQESPPNLVVIFCDDLGYGDIGCYGHPTIHTPRIDQMAREGLKCTQFYVAGNVCTPSRAALLTGRLPIRSGMSGPGTVLLPSSSGGLPATEVTLAELLREAGYATSCIGKWHLGHRPQYLPTEHGFDSYFGIPYSNDMDRGNPPLMRDLEVIEPTVDQHTLTRRYTEEAIEFIEENQERPFFLYLPHTFPHVPLYASEEFEGTSSRGAYGDVVEEIDWSVGQVLDALAERGLDEKTLVLFTSDNGPWLKYHEEGGSAGLLREGKVTTWEGGMRVPAIFRWPGEIEPGRTSLQLSSAMDLFATMCTLTNQAMPSDRILDSHDLMPMLLNEGPTTREVIFYYARNQLAALRVGSYKLHYVVRNKVQNPPLLFNVEVDPGEHWDIANRNPDIIEQINAVRDEHQRTLVRGRPQLRR